MSEEKFQDASALEDWLKGKGVDDVDAVKAAKKLLANGFNKPSRLIGITVGELQSDAKISNPLARELSNKLKEQQPDGKLRCCFCNLIFNVLFEYGNIRPDKERIDSVLLTVPLSRLFSHFRFV
jgi:hypothetical protein